MSEAWNADPDLIPGHVEKGPGSALRYVPKPTMSRGDAIRTILGVVDELADEAAVEEALMALGVNPFELFVQCR